MFQANQSFQQVVGETSGADSFLAGKGWLFGQILALLALLAGLVVMFVHVDELARAIGQINGAFSAEGVASEGWAR